MAVNVAFTSPVNRPGEPILTAEDVWNGVVATVRQPEDFVDYISKTEISEDTGLTMRRVLHFVENGSHNAPGGKLEQTIAIIPGLKIECVAAATGKATISVSTEAEEDGGHQVYLTQAFEVAYPPEVVPGSEKAVAQHAHLSKVARSNVLSNIQSFRDMKKR